MENLDLTSVVIEKGLRLDFPTERRLSALAMAWDDGANHQVCFIEEKPKKALSALGERGSMLSSADLVLPASPQAVGEASEALRSSGRARLFSREVPIPEHRRAYVDLCLPFEASEDVDLPGPFRPLKVLSIFLSALEIRGGSVFLLGGLPPALQAAERNVKATFPGLRVVGRSRGDYRHSEEEGVMSALQKAAPDLIVVGSYVAGAELWIPRHMRYTRSGIFLYTASMIEVLAGRA